MTVLEYQQTPERLNPQDLVFGRLVVREAPSVPHQRVVLNLALALVGSAREAGGELLLAPTDVVLDVGRALVLQPDLLFVARGGPAIVGDRVDGPPNLVIEVISPSQRPAEIAERVGWFAAYGIQEVWLVNISEKSIAVLQCADGTLKSRRTFELWDAVESSVLPSLRFNAGTVFGY